ncbi:MULTISPECIES: hypothetical protein [unclassified Bradyrhizobium]|uniref:hypothetical protein n=1 Tax=unclassified Bradyrhizobium TaxID=2631580 RepID=UPI0033923A28
MTPLLEVRSLCKLYPIKRAPRGARLHAVDDVDLTIGPVKASAWSANPAAANPPWFACLAG